MKKSFHKHSIVPVVAVLLRIATWLTLIQKPVQNDVVMNDVAQDELTTPVPTHVVVSDTTQTTKQLDAVEFTVQVGPQQ